MTQAQTGATFRKGRLLRSAAVSALSLSALAGGVVLSGGEAQANNSITFTDTVLSQTFTDTLTVNQAINGTETLKRLPGNPMYPDVQKTIDIDNLSGVPILGTGYYTLAVSSPDGPAWFDKAQLRWEPPAVGTAGVTKTVCSVPFSLGVCSQADTLAVINTNGGSQTWTSMPATIYIKDEVTGVGVPHMNNDFRDVPGPLPILGAGAAFGFSRKLRSRIKAASNA